MMNLMKFQYIAMSDIMKEGTFGFLRWNYLLEMCYTCMAVKLCTEGPRSFSGTYFVQDLKKLSSEGNKYRNFTL
jgi:hypothetical protein